jgi:rSAM/selenodomain-associated transferase 2
VKLSIVIPALDEAAIIRRALEALLPLRVRGHEVIVVDGGSSDGTAEIARLLCDRVVAAPGGRAAQMNAGARLATGGALGFLHADTTLPLDALEEIVSSLKNHSWGRFDVSIEGRHPFLTVIAWSMNLRSRLTGIATGDQAIFARRDAFQEAGGFPEIPLMEDIALCKRLKRVSRPLCVSERAITSGRRWEENGVLATMMLMWRLRFAYFFGADPKELARQYGYE